MQKSAVVEVRSEQLPDGKRLLKTESNLDLTINKCHIFAEKDALASRVFGFRFFS